jgi:23S rRNA (adenine2503-C2)-methyltransferase
MKDKLPGNIRHLSKNELTDLFVAQGQPAYRAAQVYDWLWKKSAHSFEEMTDLPKNLREWLNKNFTFGSAYINITQKSMDGTIKYSFLLHDNKQMEGVLIPSGKRITACVSSQVGCSLSCTFCATGKIKRERNLNADEIYDEVVLLNKQSLQDLNSPLTNIVFMGMGEPFLNYSNVLEAIEKITSQEGLKYSAKRITVSTAGIAKMIRQAGDEYVKFNLAVSLHAATDEKRNQIMPINRQIPLAELIASLKYFYQKTRSRITYEYIVFKDFNDSPEDAYNLALLCKKVPSKVNLIEYNPIDKGEYEKTTTERLAAFVAYLKSKDIIANIRHSRGKDIDAACGQLANKVMREAKLH